MGRAMKNHPVPPVRRWQSHLLGLHEFPEQLTEFELGHFFSFEPDIRGTILSRRSALHRLAAAVHIGFVRMTGRSLDAFETLRGLLVERLGRELKIPTPDLASLRTLYVSSRPRQYLAWTPL